MATQEELSEVVSADKRRFLSEVERSRADLRELVSGLRASIQHRESELSGELDRLEREQREREREYGDRMSSLTAIRAGVEEQFKGGEFEDLKRSFLSETVRKMEALEREFPSLRVEFVREEGIVDRVKGMGKIVVGVEERVEPCGVGESVGDEKVSSKEFNVEVETEELGVGCVEKPLPVGGKDYRMRTKPVATLGHPQIQCQYPQGIAYHPQENAAYFVDYFVRSIYILSLTTNIARTVSTFNCISNLQTFLPQFSGICLQNQTCYVSAFLRPTHLKIFLFHADTMEQNHYQNFGDRINSFENPDYGSPRKNNVCTPNGITIDGQTLYLCNLWKNSINVFNIKISDRNIQDIRTITDPDLHLPLDVKVHGKRVLVLNSKPPYVLEFDQTGFRRDTFLSQAILPDFLPSFLCVDRDGLLLVSDRRQPCVYVFRRERSMRAALLTRLELEHGEDPLVEPRGLCLDGEGRVLVLCCYKQAMLQIF